MIVKRDWQEDFRKKLQNISKKGEKEMASRIWVSVCQWCGQRGSTAQGTEDAPPRMNPRVPGKCKSHPAGPNMEHGPQWQKN